MQIGDANANADAKMNAEAPQTHQCRQADKADKLKNIHVRDARTLPERMRRIEENQEISL